MPLVAAYHRPATVDEALALLTEPNRLPLAGGTTVNADRSASALEVVDLQALGLSDISAGDGRVRIGATATLEDVLRSDVVPSWLREIARTEEGSSLRTLATVGGAIAVGSADSVFVAALLAADAQVELAGATGGSLEAVLQSGVPAGSIVTTVEIAGGNGAVASTGRTPADTPIVAAVAHDSGRVAVTGAASTVVLVDPDDPTAGLSPEADFRGSSAYRLELVRLLTTRALEVLR